MSKNASVSVPRIWITFVLAIGAFSPGISKSMAAEDCPSAATDIATDRPDVTNSSVVVPQGSLQSESGVNWTARQGATVVDGPTQLSVIAGLESPTGAVGWYYVASEHDRSLPVTSGHSLSSYLTRTISGSEAIPFATTSSLLGPVS